MAVARLHFDRNPRNSITLSLLAASRDHGSSILTLLEIQPDAHGASALALLRTQLDTLLRACFFAKEASEAEIEYFLAKDQMPKRRKQTGPSDWKSCTLSLNDLTPFAKSYLGLSITGTKLEDAVKATWNDLNGMVHGGAAIIHLYDADEEIRCALDEGQIDSALIKSISLLQLCAAAFIGIAKENEHEKSRACQQVFDAWMGFTQAGEVSHRSD